MSGLNTLTQLAGQLNQQGEQLGEMGNQVKDIQRPLNHVLPTSMAWEKTRENAKGMTGGFKNLGEFSQCVRHYQNPTADAAIRQKAAQQMEKWGNEFQIRQKEMAVYSQKANSPLGMNESFSLSEGGVLVPPEFVANILMRTYGNDIVSRTTILPIAGNSIKIPAINETSRADGSRFGGIRAYHRAEAGTVDFSKPSLKNINLELDSAMLLVRTTSELLEDAGGALEVLLTLVAGQEMQFIMGNDVINGDGVGKPLGIMEARAKIVAAAEASQTGGSAQSILTANVLNMYSRLHVSCRPNAIWLYDQTIEPSLYTMTIGTAGSQLAVFLPTGGNLQGEYVPRLLGRPMIATEFGKPLGTEGDLILWDPTTYLMATKGGVQTAVSMHLYFSTNEMAFRFVIRYDGKPWWLNPLTPKSGGPTQSCIVTLATRA